MLLTIPWALSIYYGRVKLDFGATHEGQPGRGTYKKSDAVDLMESEYLVEVGKSHTEDLQPAEVAELKCRTDCLKGGKHKLPEIPGCDVSSSAVGVNCGPSIKTSAYMMLATACGYLIIQGSAFAANCAMTTDNAECAQTNSDDTALIGNGKEEKIFAWLGLGYCLTLPV